MPSDPPQHRESRRVRSQFEERRSKLKIEILEEFYSLKSVLPNVEKLQLFATYVSVEHIKSVEDPEVIQAHFKELEHFLISLTDVVRRYELVAGIPDEPDGE